MITITERSRDFSKIEEYLMTLSPAIVSMHDVDDETSIQVAGVLIFKDTKDDGEEVEIMSIITPSNTVYSCQSKTFKRSLFDILHIMGDNPFSIVKTSGTTKAGRHYINCVLDIEALA